MRTICGLLPTEAHLGKCRSHPLSLFTSPFKSTTTFCLFVCIVLLLDQPYGAEAQWFRIKTKTSTPTQTRTRTSTATPTPTSTSTNTLTAVATSWTCSSCTVAVGDPLFCEYVSSSGEALRIDSSDSEVLAVESQVSRGSNGVSTLATFRALKTGSALTTVDTIGGFHQQMQIVVVSQFVGCNLRPASPTDRFPMDSPCIGYEGYDPTAAPSARNQSLSKPACIEGTEIDADSVCRCTSNSLTCNNQTGSCGTAITKCNTILTLAATETTMQCPASASATAASWTLGKTARLASISATTKSITVASVRQTALSSNVTVSGFDQFIIGSWTLSRPTQLTLATATTVDVQSSLSTDRAFELDASAAPLLMNVRSGATVDLARTAQLNVAQFHSARDSVVRVRNNGDVSIGSESSAARNDSFAIMEGNFSIDSASAVRFLVSQFLFNGTCSDGGMIRINSSLVRTEGGSKKTCNLAIGSPVVVSAQEGEDGTANNVTHRRFHLLAVSASGTGADVSAGKWAPCGRWDGNVTIEAGQALVLDTDHCATVGGTPTILGTVTMADGTWVEIIAPNSSVAAGRSAPNPTVLTLAYIQTFVLKGKIPVVLKPSSDYKVEYTILFRDVVSLAGTNSFVLSNCPAATVASAAAIVNNGSNNSTIEPGSCALSLQANRLVISQSYPPLPAEGLPAPWIAAPIVGGAAFFFVVCFICYQRYWKKHLRRSGDIRRSNERQKELEKQQAEEEERRYRSGSPTMAAAAQALSPHYPPQFVSPGQPPVVDGLLSMPQPTPATISATPAPGATMTTANGLLGSPVPPLSFGASPHGEGYIPTPVKVPATPTSVLASGAHPDLTFASPIGQVVYGYPTNMSPQRPPPSFQQTIRGMIQKSNAEATAKYYY